MRPALLLLTVTSLAAADISIRFVDPAGTPVAGISVRFMSGDRAAGTCITDLEGNCRLTIQDGRYKINLPDPQLEPESADIRFSGAKPDRSTVRLRIGTLAQQVTVSAGDSSELSLERTDNADQTTLDSDWLDALPALDQDVLSLADMFLSSGDTPAITIDGMEVDDVNVPRAAIQEIRINQSPFSAEYFRPSSGRIDVITKSAASQYQGSVDVYLRNSRFDARNAFALERPAANRRGIDAILQGPIGSSGKTAFSASVEHRAENTYAFLYAITPEGLRQGNIPTPASETEFALRLDRHPSDRSSWTLRWETERESEENIGVGGQALPETAANATQREQSVRFTHNYFRSASANQFRVYVARSSDDIVSAVTGVPRVVVNDAFTAGSAQASEQSNRYRISTENVYGISTARQTLRVGVEMRNAARYSYTDLSLRDGVLSYASLGDYLAGRPLSFLQRSGSGRAAFWQSDVALFGQLDRKVRDDLNVGFGLRYDYLPFVGSMLSPRASIAWAPGKSKKTVLRGGIGLYSDWLDRSAVRDSLLFDGERIVESFIVDPVLPIQGPLVRSTPNLVRLNHDLSPPQVMHVSAGIERKLTGRSAIFATYQGARGWNLFRTLDANAPFQGERPDPSLGLVRDVQSTAGMMRHAVDFGMRGRISQYLTTSVNYTLGRRWSDTSGDLVLPANSRNLSQEWARINGDRLHRLRALADVRAGNWFRTGLILSAQSGTPVNLTTGVDENGDGLAIDRPLGVSRNSLQAPGSVSLDARLSREFDIGRGERAPSIRLALDAFNLLNHVNPTRVVGNMRSPFFLQPTAAAPARRLQVSMRFTF